MGATVIGEGGAWTATQRIYAGNIEEGRLVNDRFPMQVRIDSYRYFCTKESPIVSLT